MDTIKKEAKALLEQGYNPRDINKVLWSKYRKKFTNYRHFDNVIGTYIRRIRKNNIVSSDSDNENEKIISITEAKKTSVTEDRLKGTADGELEAPKGKYKTDEDLLDELGLSSKEYEVVSVRKSNWDAQSPDGVIPMESFKISAQKKKKYEPTPEELKKIIQEGALKAATAVTYPKTPEFDVKSFASNRIGVLQICDMHFGAYCSAKQHGIDWGPKECKEDINHIIDQAVTVAQVNDVDCILLLITGDGLNSDNWQKTTVHGTQQDNGLLTADELFKGYLDICQNVINRIINEVQVPVNFIHTLGNHDQYTATLATVTLEMIYKENPNVKILDEKNYRKYRRYGNSLLMFSHGQAEGKRAITCPQNEASKAWGETEFTYVFTEHTHTFKMNDDGRTVQLVGATIAPPGTWTKESAYVGARRGARLAIIDKTYGLTSDNFLYVKNNNSKIDEFVIDVENIF